MMRIKRITNRKDLQSAFDVREIVFIEEQGVPKTEEFDQYDVLDRGTEHILLLDKEVPVGTGRVRFTGEYGKLERICILEPFRSKGFGIKIIEELEIIAIENKVRKVKLHGQTQASGFYQKMGYRIKSEEFIEDGIAHFLMTKELQ